MATWIAHLRVAENILKRGYDLEHTSFVLGNIGPDSGVPNDDWSRFDPPTAVTHWKDEKGKINPQWFWDKYLQEESVKNNKAEYSFKLGYYVHLLTDVEWSRINAEKTKDLLYKEKLEKDKNFIWIIKKDWYGLDYIYLEKHPQCVFHTIFKHVDKVPDYLDYFPKGAFEKQVKYITQFYLGELRKILFI